MTLGGKRVPKVRIRLLWDEDLSSLVPKALRVLDIRATYVGCAEDGAPPRGSTDRVVVEFALRTNQIIVTKNHDMMTLCDELGQRFVWLDPRGKKLSREHQVVLVFQQVREWEQFLAADPATCVVARRTGCSPIASAEASRLAFNRIRVLERRKRQKTARGLPLGGLLDERAPDES